MGPHVRSCLNMRSMRVLVSDPFTPRRCESRFTLLGRVSRFTPLLQVRVPASYSRLSTRK